jgi:pyridoxal 5'-phosphate synthase pdxT subunit
MTWVGILSLQGGFAAHARALHDIGLEAREVRDARDLGQAGGLVLPGGESTAQLRLIERHGLAESLAAFIASGRPALATCAGLILAARRVRPGRTPSSPLARGAPGDSSRFPVGLRSTSPRGAAVPVSPLAASEEGQTTSQRSFGWLDVEVERNAYGRQLDSFEDRSDEGLPLVFIRAPRIVALGSGVSVLARWRGEPVLVRKGSVTGATFHPELTPDRRVHRLAFASLTCTRLRATPGPGDEP